MKPADFLEVARIEYGEKAIEMMTGLEVPEEIYALAIGTSSVRQSDGTWICSMTVDQIKKLVLEACKLADEEKDRQDPEEPVRKRKPRYESPYKTILGD